MELVDGTFFQKTESYIGEVRVGSNILCIAQADITQNKFSHEGASIRLIVLETFGDFSELAPFQYPQILNQLKFLYIVDGTQVSCDISLPGFNSNNSKFEITGVIDELTILHQYKEVDKDTKLNLHYSYDLPLCSIVAGIRWTTNHNHLGRFNGVMKDYKWGDRESLVEWSNDFLEFEANNRKVLIYENTEYQDQKQDLMGHTISLSIKSTRVSIEEIVADKWNETNDTQAREVIEAVTLALSFIEHNRFSWNYEKLSVNSTDDENTDHFVERQTHKRAYRYDNDTFSTSKQRKSNELRALLSEMVTYTLSLNEEKLTQFKQIMDAYTLAATANYLEMSFSLWA